MAITGTQIKSGGGSIKNYFINKVTIQEAELAQSNYTDCNIRLAMTDESNGTNILYMKIKTLKKIMLVKLLD